MQHARHFVDVAAFDVKDHTGEAIDMSDAPTEQVRRGSRAQAIHFNGLDIDFHECASDLLRRTAKRLLLRDLIDVASRWAKVPECRKVLQADLRTPGNAASRKTCACNTLKIKGKYVPDQYWHRYCLTFAKVGTTQIRELRQT